MPHRTRHKHRVFKNSRETNSQGNRFKSKTNLTTLASKSHIRRRTANRRIGRASERVQKNTRAALLLSAASKHHVQSEKPSPLSLSIYRAPLVGIPKAQANAREQRPLNNYSGHLRAHPPPEE